MQYFAPTKLLQWLLNPGPLLSQRALNATVWTLGSKVVERTVSYIRIISLARLLTPLDFGLIGLGLIVISALQALSMPGFFDALVQKKGEIKEYLDTLWTFTVSRSLIVAGVLALSAPVVANIFNSPDARLVMQAMAGAEMLIGLANPGLVYFQKDLEFHKKTATDVLPTLAEVLVAVTAAVILRNVWALVIGLYAHNITFVAVSYLSHPYRPHLSWKRHQAKELFGFSRWVYLSRVLNFVSNQADSLVLARLLGPVTLGFYQMAQRTSLVPLQELRRGFATVAFPVYSRVQDDLTRLKRAFINSVDAVASIALPLAVAVAVLAQDFVTVVLGEKWLPAVPAIQILALAGALNSITGTGTSLFMGSGQPQLNFHMMLLKAIVVLAAVYPLTTAYGIAGASYAALLATALSFVFYVYHSQKILRMTMSDAFKAMFPAVGVSIAVGIVGAGARAYFGPMNLLTFLGTAVLVVVVYGSVLLLLGWKLKIGLVSSLARMKRQYQQV